MLAIASMLVISGCAIRRSETDLEAYRAELRDLLASLASNDADEVTLLSIAQRISIRSGDLVAEHEEFAVSFGALMGERDATEEQLADMVDQHQDRRKWLRDDLLRLQDELHAQLGPDEWVEVTAVLNRKAPAVSGAAISGA
ncbi:MAG: hypothetical protein ACR2QV_12230 [Gammaproteobacteria bacterium]